MPQKKQTPLESSIADRTPIQGLRMRLVTGGGDLVLGLESSFRYALSTEALGPIDLRSDIDLIAWAIDLSKHFGIESSEALSPRASDDSVTAQTWYIQIY